MIKWQGIPFQLLSIGLLCAQFTLVGVFASGCAPQRNYTPQATQVDNPLNKLSFSVDPAQLTPEEAKAVIGVGATNWFYGQGVGETFLTVSSIALFPPSALLFLGQGALELAGYEKIKVSELLPDPVGAGWGATYDSVTSVPGRLNAGAAGIDYIDQASAERRIHVILERKQEQPAEH